MSDNQIKENELRKVTGGAGERPIGFENAKYDIGFNYDSGLLWSGMPNHHIVITVKGYAKVENNVIYYNLEYKESAYGCPTITEQLVKPESYIDDRKHDK